MTIHDVSPTSLSSAAVRPNANSSEHRALHGVALAASVLSGLFAGFFLTYSMSVVIGLGEVGDRTYVETFQAINATIRNPTFAVVFFGTVPIALLATVLTSAATPQRRLLFALGTASLLATVVITFIWNVPLNDQLATYVDLDATSAATARAEFEGTWNRWNLVRTITSVLGATLVCAATARRR